MKNERGKGLHRKIFDGDCSQSYLRPKKFRKLQYSTQIVKKDLFNSKQIIQILQPMIHSYIVDIS